MTKLKNLSLYPMKHRFIRIFLSWIILVQMVNLSIDPARHMTVLSGTLTMSEDLSINRIESIYELISEIVFKVEVPETQDADEDSLQKNLTAFHLPALEGLHLDRSEIPVRHNFAYLSRISDYVPALKAPPPRRA